MSRAPTAKNGRVANDVILDAVESLLTGPAPAKVTIDAAARASGFSKGGVLYNFPTKDALMLGVLDRLAEEMRAEVAARRDDFPAADSPTLAAMIETMRAWAPKRRGLACALMAALMENPELKTPVDALFADLRERILSEAARPRRVMAVWAALEGLHFASSFKSTAFPDDEIDGLLDELQTLLTDRAPQATEPAT